ncbi:MAG: hypothetical protein V3U48_10320 [Rhodospirillales bacterium]
MKITDFIPTGLPFVQSLLFFLSGFLIATGLALWAFETGPEEGLKNVRRKLGEGWQNLSAAPWGTVLPCMSVWLVKKLENLIRSGFQEADKGIAFGGLVLVLVLVFIPFAATINALIGGSPFLFRYYLLLLAALVILNFAGETGRFRFINALAAAFLGVSLLVIIPFYVLRSFTDVVVHSQGFLKSLLVALFWYMAAYGAGLVFDTALRFGGLNPNRLSWARFVHGFLAALPVAYILTFLALWFGQRAVLQQDAAQTWQLVLLSIVLTAFSLPVTLRFMSAGERTGPEPKPEPDKGNLFVIGAYGAGLAVAVGLSWVLAMGFHFGTDRAYSWGGALNLMVGLTSDGKQVYLGSDFWVSHLPFVPWLLFLAAVVAGYVSKATLQAFHAFAGRGASIERPFLASALSCGTMAAVVFVSAVLI